MSIADEIKQNLDIVAVVSASVPLAKAGRNFKARCPFHSERTPSFYVFPDRQTWRCFGACATGGDVFSFTMRQENVAFGEALRLLASRAGVTVPDRYEAPEDDQRLARLRTAHQTAALYYHHRLLHGDDAGEARAYVEKRGIAPEASAAFLLGYSPAQRGALRAHLMAQGYTQEELVEAGLLMESGADAIDRFHNRLMFPIRDSNGAVVGFGARSLDGSNPKYLNSPQSPLFDKSGLLYGLDLARDAIRTQKRAVIVEGYMDALMAHQCGHHNVVASMGTSLTEKQVRALSRLTTSIVLALDADAAGQAATLRSLEVAPEAMGEVATAEPAWQGRVRRKQVGGRQVIYALPRGTARIVAQRKGEIRVLELPRGKDPDELLRSDPAIWEQLVQESLPMMDFLLKSVQQRYDLNTPRGKADAAAEALPLLADLPTVEQAHYLQRLATLVGVEEHLLQQELRQSGKRPQTPRQDEPRPTGLEQHLQKTEVLEDYCLALLLQTESLRPHASGLRPDHFLSTENREIFRAWLEHPDEDPMTLVDDVIQARLLDILALSLPEMLEHMAEAALAQCIHRLEERRLRDLKLHNRARLAAEEQEQGAKEMAALGYLRWQALRNGQPEAPPPETSPEEPPAATEVQEQEIALNQQLQELMAAKRLRPTGSNAVR
ncbi:MAG: DNA primase [Chloroflexi bacterium]|nr:DNA primase [Chloroflexota bacterium]